MWYREMSVENVQEVLMTTIYFIRHAEPNYENHEDALRELSAKGMQDRKLVTEFLADKEIDFVFSSPYRRAIDTIADFASQYGFEIQSVYDFRERRIDRGWIDDFTAFCKKQWADFTFKLSEGESLGEVQKRNIAALNVLLKEYEDKKIVVGSHGTAMSTIMSYYDNTFGYEEFEEIKGLMPWIVQFTFDGMDCIDISQYNLFQ